MGGREECTLPEPMLRSECRGPEKWKLPCLACQIRRTGEKKGGGGHQAADGIRAATPSPPIMPSWPGESAEAADVTRSVTVIVLLLNLFDKVDIVEVHHKIEVEKKFFKQNS